MKGILLLEDGTLFEGILSGPPGEKMGEVVLNTAVVGYQELITNPAFAGKILVLTYPLIGNYGTACKFSESKKCWVEGLVIKEKSRVSSNWQSKDTFEAFVKKKGVMLLSGIDTRTLAVRIRDKGEMLGIIAPSQANKRHLIKKLKTAKKSAKKSFIKKISVRVPEKIGNEASGPRIAVIDLGVSNSLIAQLKELGCAITLFPYNTPQKEILGLKPDGMIISDGPENDQASYEIVDNVKALLGKVPILGISLGHEIIGLALGGSLKKMKMGHRGVNYPAILPDSFKGEITAQNHSFVIDEDSIKHCGEVKVTLRNLNDDTIEEMESGKLKFISVQYSPGSPGFGRPHPVFHRFLGLIGKKCQNAKT
jgi:carbamoyl-phosphate synthase small subunit